MRTSARFITPRVRLLYFVRQPRVEDVVIQWESEVPTHHPSAHGERLRTSVNQLLPGCLPSYLRRSLWAQTDRGGTQARRDQGLQHKHVCLQSGVSGTKAGGWGRQAVCCGCLIASPLRETMIDGWSAFY